MALTAEGGDSNKDRPVSVHHRREWGAGASAWRRILQIRPFFTVKYTSRHGEIQSTGEPNKQANSGVAVFVVTCTVRSGKNRCACCVVLTRGLSQGFSPCLCRGGFLLDSRISFCIGGQTNKDEVRGLKESCIQPMRDAKSVGGKRTPGCALILLLWLPV